MQDKFDRKVSAELWKYMLKKLEDKSVVELLFCSQVLLSFAALALARDDDEKAVNILRYLAASGDLENLVDYAPEKI